MKVFVDANVLFTAAHNPSGKSAKLLANAKALDLTMVTNSYAIGEAIRNIVKKYPSQEATLHACLKQVTIVPLITQGSAADGIADKDKPILLSALQANCDVLLTGDKKDFLTRRATLKAIEVLSPSELLEKVESNAG